MKKITEETPSNGLLKVKRHSSVFYTAIIGLHVGEKLFIGTDEWTNSKTPSRICRYIEKKHSVLYQCQRRTDENGWALKRVK